MRNNQLFEKYPDGHWERKPAIYAQEYANHLSGGSTLLDIGCSKGRDVKQFSETGHRAMGIDLDLLALHDAVSKELSVAQMNACFLGIAPASLDATFMINAIHYVDNPIACADQVWQALRPGGTWYLHFNLEIASANGIDYSAPEEEIEGVRSRFKTVNAEIDYRKDIEPYPHVHKILKLYLEK